MKLKAVRTATSLGLDNTFLGAGGTCLCEELSLWHQICSWGSLIAQLVKNVPAMRRPWFNS